MSCSDLEGLLRSLCETDPRLAGEIAYVLAVFYKKEGNSQKAVEFGRAAIALFDRCQMDTLADCVAHTAALEGIPLPEIIHQEVVRAHLQPLVL